MADWTLWQRLAYYTTHIDQRTRRRRARRWVRVLTRSTLVILLLGLCLIALLWSPTKPARHREPRQVVPTEGTMR